MADFGLVLRTLGLGYQFIPFRILNSTFRTRKMLIRIVRMTFRPDALDEFLALFDDASPKIRAFPGCEHLELWQDARYPNILSTYSHWTDADALNDYRHSDLFKTTWARTKPLFAAPPTAQSQHVLRNV